MFRPIVYTVCVLLFVPPLHSFAQYEKKAQEEKKPFKRRGDSTDEDLRKQLLLTPEVGFDQPAASLLLKTIRSAAATVPMKGVPAATVPPDIGFRFYSQLAQQLKRPELLALPWRKGADSQLGKETAEGLHVYSVNLRLAMRQSVPTSDVRPDADKLKGILGGKGRFEKPLEWNKADCVPTLAQMLQTENTPLRLLMIGMLAKVEGKAAGGVLAQRAVFDMSPDVREKAVEALAQRPAKEYQQTLLDGLRSPWQPAADHAAEAIAALRMKDAVPQMVAMLKEADPKLPFTKDGEADKDKGTFVREMVRINHLSNCLLCHAPSMSREDLVRGRVPAPGEDMPPLYYAETRGEFVRADTTFLRQDFSLVQPVANPGKWPGQQRFDYVVRTRKATAKEIKLFQGLQKEKKLGAPYGQRESLLFALREVTGVDHGSSIEGWLPLLNPIEKKSEPK